MDDGYIFICSFGVIGFCEIKLRFWKYLSGHNPRVNLSWLNDDVECNANLFLKKIPHEDCLVLKTLSFLWRDQRCNQQKMAMVKSPVAGFVEISWHGRLQCDGLTFFWKVFLFNMVCQAQIGQLGSLGAKCICSFWPLIMCKLPQVLCYITSNSSNPEWLACSSTDWS